MSSEGDFEAGSSSQGPPAPDDADAAAPDAQSLTPEQEAFLAECEREFADRYTERDKEYTDFKARDEGGPPCVYPWRPPRQDHGRQVASIKIFQVLFRVFRGIVFVHVFFLSMARNIKLT